MNAYNTGITSENPATVRATLTTAMRITESLLVVRPRQF